ncbi:hypothetical protein LIX60_31335 [Streptomyces sp. S07_1.15]|uniref:hypothetical protein n=1 Tax=Streptomyces sp. S07_1.15 TaxID=2873925 RepID=UPI001D15C2E7|nr:hypothetical protein [Streptomyces sp. S07_1.15]MCC3655878.1 hypothetical protein [Streptomyces sp. S07_1.15]
MPKSEANNLVAALEAGTVTGAQCPVVELDGMVPASRGALFSAGWDDGVRAVSEALVGIADQECGPSTAAGSPGPLNWPYTSRT